MWSCRTDKKTTSLSCCRKSKCSVQARFDYSVHKSKNKMLNKHFVPPKRCNDHTILVSNRSPQNTNWPAPWTLRSVFPPQFRVFWDQNYPLLLKISHSTILCNSCSKCAAIARRTWLRGSRGLATGKTSSKAGNINQAYVRCICMHVWACSWQNDLSSTDHISMDRHVTMNWATLDRQHPEEVWNGPVLPWTVSNKHRYIYIYIWVSFQIHIYIHVYLLFVFYCGPQHPTPDP